jgi:uncharacterized protein YbaR (Trm112 family)
MKRVRDEVLSIIRGEDMTERAQPSATPTATSAKTPSSISATTGTADMPATTDLPEPSDPVAPRIEPWLREILRCPQCRSTLSDGSGPDGPELQCTNPECRLAYRIDDGIPVLLVDESRSLAN